MIKKVLQGSIVLFLCFVTLNSHTQEKCPFPSTTIKPFVAGYPHRDSLLVTEMLRAGKLDTKYDGFEVISFHISTDGNCLGSGLYTEVHSNSNDFTGEAIALLKRATPGQKLFLDHVHLVNNSGQIYCSPAVSFYISKPNATATCPTLPYKAFIAGHPDSTRLTVDQLLKGGRLVTNVNGYEITSFVIGTSVTRGAVIWCGEIRNTGADFSDEIKNLLRHLKPGHVFLIDAVNVRNQAGQTFCLEKIKMTVR
jgi:hypothetical protein